MNAIAKNMNLPSFRQQIFCPDCGKTREKSKVWFKGLLIKGENWNCDCQKKNNGLGYDWKVRIEKRDAKPLYLMQTVCSGIENRWIKNEIHCPVCGHRIPIIINSSQSDINVPCPNCKIIGLDYQVGPGAKAVVTASGWLDDIQQYNEKHFRVNTTPDFKK